MPLDRASRIDIAAACRGDHSAFDRLIRVYDQRLRALAFHMLGSQEAMDDALQDAYLAAYRNLRRFRGEADVGTWLRRIVYNECLQQLRRRAADGRKRADALVSPPGVGSDVSDEVALRDQLRRALAALPPSQRAAVVLVRIEAMSYEDAAEVLDVPVGTVASRVAAARASLAKSLGLRDGEGGG
jgi:RNA polymerase sigma-70 factor, ECF subfamily